jgi:hypothetical protein
MRPKYGFNSYAKSKVPLKHPLNRVTKTPVEPEGKLLPNTKILVNLNTEHFSHTFGLLPYFEMILEDEPNR